jgi:hypothetical protein
MKQVKFFSIILSLAFFASCDKDNDYTPPTPVIQSNVIKASGDAAGIAAQVDQFRTLIGAQLNTTPGQTTGRREVNWDGVPSALTNNNNFPLDFFNLTDPNGANGRKRGLVYLDKGSPFRLDSSSFTEIDATYADELIAFSQKKSIIAANSNSSEIVFKVAGTNTDAFVKGFGIIFLDVDDANSSSLEFFNGTKSLGVFKAPARTQAGPFSFLGVQFPAEKITRVKITAGNAVLAAGLKDITDGGNKDIVSYDDLFYSEPLSNN